MPAILVPNKVHNKAIIITLIQIHRKEYIFIIYTLMSNKSSMSIFDHDN